MKWSLQAVKELREGETVRVNAENDDWSSVRLPSQTPLQFLMFLFSVTHLIHKSWKNTLPSAPATDEALALDSFCFLCSSP